MYDAMRFEWEAAKRQSKMIEGRLTRINVPRPWGFVRVADYTDGVQFGRCLLTSPQARAVVILL